MTALLTHSARAITDGWMAFLRILSANYGIKFVIGENVPPKRRQNLLASGASI